MKLISLFALTGLLATLPTLAWAADKEREKSPRKEEEEIPELEGEPSDHYFGGYLLFKDGESLRKEGRLEEAERCLHRALGKFKGVRKKWPAWKKEIVEMRVEKTEEALKSLEKEMGKEE